MIIRLVLFLLILIGSVTANAQRDFRNGFIITLDNDSVPGKVFNRESEKRFEECRFLKDGETEAKVYDASQINGYFISGSRSFLAKDLIIDFNRKKVFAEVYVYGKATLLMVYDKYFLEKDGSFTELIETKTNVYVKGSEYVNTDKKYLIVLRQALTGCPKIEESIAKTLFNGPSLSKVIDKYNDCFQTTQKAMVNNKRWFQLLAGLTAGHSSVALTGFDQTFLGLANIDPSQFGKDENLFPGLSFEANSPRTTENLVLHLDIFYQKNSLQSKFTKGPLTTAVSWKFETLNAPIGVAYYFLNLKNFRVFIEGGVSPYWRLNGTNKLKSETLLTSGLVIDDSALATENKTNVLAYAGAGILYSPTASLSLMLKFRYETGDFNVTNDQALKKTSTDEMISILYKLSK